MSTTLATIVIVSIVASLFFFLIIFQFAKWDKNHKASLKFEADREKTHREIAAHVAAGALAPEDAERLLNAMSHADESTSNQSRRPLATQPSADQPIPAHGSVTEPA